MTALEADAVTLPTPHPGPGAVIRGTRAVTVCVGRCGERLFRAGWTVVCRWPKTTTVIACLVTAATPVTVREVAGVVVGGCVTGAVDSRWGSSGEGTKPLAILTSLSTFRRRRRRIRRRWVTVMHDCGLLGTPVHAGDARRRPRVVRITATPHGARVHVYAAHICAGPSDFRGRAERIRHGFGCRDVTVSTHRHLVVLDLMWSDPLARPIPAVKLPAPAKHLHAVVGLDEHGRGIEKDMRLSSLVVGAPGAGKSTEAWTTLHALLAARIPFRLRVFDPKGGMELGALRGRVHRYVSDPSSWDTFIGDALQDLTGRQQRMAAAGLREHTPTRAEPLDVMLVDELVTALAMGGTGSKVKVGGKTITAERAFLVFLSQCRAAGFTVLAATQVVEKNVLGPVRDLFGYVSVLRVGPTETSTVDMALGAGAHKVHPAHELDPASSAGIGWIRTTAGVVRYRAAYLTDAQRGRVVEQLGRRQTE